MEAVADQRQFRIAKRNVQIAEVTAQANQILLVQETIAPTRGKVDAKGFSETAVRSLFECMVNELVKESDEFLKYLTQNLSMCKTKIPAKVVDIKIFAGNDTLVIYTYHKTTGMVTVVSAAVVLDGTEKMLTGVLKVSRDRASPRWSAILGWNPQES